jgi:hypothetical protein
MEVSVLTESGLPEGCILSIRSGTVRRQAPISSGKAFKFPEPLSNPLKFDLFMPLASGHLVTRPGEEQYKVDFGEGGAMNCELQVMPSVSSSTACTKPPAEDLESKKDSSAAGAKEFLEQHAILEFVQAVLHTIITERPKDPYMEMARHFMCGYKGNEKRSDLAKTMVQKPMETPTPVPDEIDKRTEPASMATEEAQMPVASSATVPDGSKKFPSGYDALFTSNRDPEQVPEQAPPDDHGEDLRLKIKEKLLASCETGELQSALESVVFVDNRVTGGPEYGDDLRNKMRTSLVAACDTGQLAVALQSVVPVKTGEGTKSGPSRSN